MSTRSRKASSERRVRIQREAAFLRRCEKVLGRQVRSAASLSPAELKQLAHSFKAPFPSAIQEGA